MRDDGQAGVEFALAVGVLLFPVALVVMSFGPWSEAKVDAEAIAAEAARSAVIALDQSEGTFVGLTMARSLGHDGDRFRIGWCGGDPGAPGTGSCPFARGTAVDVVVEVWTPLVTTPWGDIGGLWVAGDHSEPIDVYRSLD